MTNLFKRVFGGKEDISAVPSANGNGTPGVEPIHVTDEDFDEVILQSDLPALVDLWAEWCGPCHMIAPSVQDLAVEYEGRAIIAKLNVDENPTTSGRFGIMGIPTLLYFKNGKEVDRQVGVAGYPQLASKLEKLLD